MKIRRFVSTDGHDILVGQNDESNDRLTFKIGRANDIWMHVSGVPGSHVILCCGESKDRLDKKNLEEAAALAAWFSKMRNGGKVAVNYCRVKDVSKPRGAKPGSVTIRNSKKITVTPALLPESDENINH